MRGSLMFLSLALAGCAGRAEDVPAPPAGACDAARAGSLVGTQADAELADRARSLSAAKAVRVIRPGDAVTMDYRQDRLNVEVDRDGRVTAVRCG